MMFAILSPPLLAQAAEPPPVQPMNALGWTFMIVSMSSVLALVIFCYYRVLTNPPAANHMQAPQTLDTHDKGT